MNEKPPLPRRDLGLTTSIEVVNQYLSLEGKFVIDAGCGDMTFTIPLVEQGARVLAIDPDPVQADLNRRSQSRTNLEFVESGAETLPVADGSVDGVFFSYSLHHIPTDGLPGVFEEVFRVLKEDGFLLVIEPIDCPLNQVMRLFHNEDRERESAQQALLDLAVPHFGFVEVVTYHSFIQYDSFDQFADRYANRSFNSMYTEADVRRAQVSDAFERLGQPDYRFRSPKQAMVLREFRGCNGRP